MKKILTMIIILLLALGTVGAGVALARGKDNPKDPSVETIEPLYPEWGLGGITFADGRELDYKGVNVIPIGSTIYISSPTLLSTLAPLGIRYSAPVGYDVGHASYPDQNIIVDLGVLSYVGLYLSDTDGYLRCIAPFDFDIHFILYRQGYPIDWFTVKYGYYDRPSPVVTPASDIGRVYVDGQELPANTVLDTLPAEIVFTSPSVLSGSYPLCVQIVLPEKYRGYPGYGYMYEPVMSQACDRPFVFALYSDMILISCVRPFEGDIELTLCTGSADLFSVVIRIDFGG